MGITKARLDAQVQSACEYTDTVAPTEAAFETTPTCAEDDFHNVISQLNNLLTEQSGNWYDGLVTPNFLDMGGPRGVNSLNTDLHALERKRFIETNKVLVDVVVGATDNFVILPASALPGNLVMAVDMVPTLGTVAASHMGVFGTHSLDEVPGTHALGPCNIILITDSAGDPILDSSGRVISGLLQTEDSADGHTASSASPTRLQISFVVPNATHDDLIPAPAADIQGKTIRYCYCEQKAFEDLTKGAFATKSAAIDIGAGAVSLTRQAAYDGQGTLPVDITTNATLDLEGPGITWQIRDDLEAPLITVSEGSATGTSEFGVSSEVDVFNVDAIANDFENGATFDSGAAGTAINVGVTPNQIDSAGPLNLASGAAQDLTLTSGNEVLFVDGYQAGSTWGVPLELASSSMEWDEAEAKFGEVSLLNMICQAFQSSALPKTCVDVTAVVPAGTSVTAANLSGPLHDASGGTYATDHDLYYNGILLREGATNDYTAGTDLTAGEFILAFDTKPGDNICLISRA